MKILVAEDDAVTRRVLMETLASNVVEVVSASDGVEALRAVEQYAPAVILLDWLMPNIDGLDVCRRIRLRPQPRRPHIVMVTSRGSTDDIVSAFGAGADDYITKPYDLDELRARVCAGLRQALHDEVLMHETAMLQAALARLHSLPETIPICASCKRVRDGGHWYPVEQFVSEHTGVHFSHGLCSACVPAFE